jgi:hypothetical protein
VTWISNLIATRKGTVVDIRAPMKVDDDGLAFTGQRFSKTLGLDPNLQLNLRASSGFASAVLGGHLRHLPLRR